MLVSAMPSLMKHVKLAGVTDRTFEAEKWSVERGSMPHLAVIGNGGQCVSSRRGTIVWLE